VATILIVDDTPTNLGVMVGHLEAQGYRVLIAQDGEEGLQRAELTHPDAILLDVMMAGVSGFEVCRRLKSRSSTREIPVILMTSLTETRDKVAGFAAGAVDYVTKPLQAEEVMARLDTHLKLHAAQTQLEEQNSLLAMYREDLEGQVAEHAAALQVINRRLLAEVSARERAQQQVRTLNDELAVRVARMSPLIADLLTYARTGQPELRPEPVALEPLLRELTDRFATRLAAAGAAVEVRRPLAMPLADAALVRQILANLLDYALSSRRADAAPRIRLSAALDGGLVLLRVADNGIGIATAQQRRVFELFERRHDDDGRPGGGIVLPIVAKAARLLGGNVSVESCAGEGNTFTVRLPAAPAESGGLGGS
jgi:two-component system, sensor histidine kinase and response regulator